LKEAGILGLASLKETWKFSLPPVLAVLALLIRTPTARSREEDPLGRLGYRLTKSASYSSTTK
jgi:hypothetical protein